MEFKTKFNVDDEIYYISNKQIVKGIVFSVHCMQSQKLREIFYSVMPCGEVCSLSKLEDVNENDAGATKEETLEKIEQKLKSKLWS